MNKLLGVLAGLIVVVKVSSSTIFSVEPNLQSAIAVNDSFKDSLYITDVVGMAAWQACVCYDPSVIRWKSQKEGPFMTSVSSTWFLISLDDTTMGQVLIASMFWPMGEPYHTVSGSGSVIYITWQVKSTGKSPIRIRHEDTYLTDTLDVIPFDTVDGWYNPPTVRVKSPNGSEDWSAGSSHNITWTTGGVSLDVKIELYKGGNLNSTIAIVYPPDTSYTWAIPVDQTAGSDYKVKILSKGTPSIYDYSDADFNIPPVWIEESTTMPLAELALSPYPNPFSRTTEIRIQKTEYRLPEVRNQKSDVKLMIYDLTGRLVRTFLISARLTLGFDPRLRPSASTLGFELGSRSSGREARVEKLAEVQLPIPNSQFCCLGWY